MRSAHIPSLPFPSVRGKSEGGKRVEPFYELTKRRNASQKQSKAVKTGERRSLNLRCWHLETKSGILILSTKLLLPIPV